MVKAKIKTQKSRKKQREIVVDKQISKLCKNLQTDLVGYTPTGSKHLVYKSIPIELLVNETTEKGRKVMVSIYPVGHDIYFIQVLRSKLTSRKSQISKGGHHCKVSSLEIFRCRTRYPGKHWDHG